MASRKQRIANRDNARQPRNMSEQGRQTVSGNALRHGLTSNKVLLDYEDAAAYHALRDDLLRERAPATVEEHFLVDQIAQNMWRLQRARRVETSYYNSELEIFCIKNDIDTRPGSQNLDLDPALSALVTGHSSKIDTLRRYETGIERTLHKSIRELDRLQSEHRKSQVAKPAAEKQIGSVSQFPATPTIEKPIREPETHSAAVSAHTASNEFGSVSQFPPNPSVETQQQPHIPPILI